MATGLLLLACLCILSWGKHPHVIFVMVDDVGYADVGYHGAEFTTPTINKLAGDGLKLENYHVHATCTPTRAAFLTGRYGFRMGLAGHLMPTSPGGLPKGVSTIGGMLQDKGYRTHHVGKWHLGHSKWSQMPHKNGFHSFLGILGAANGHWSHFFPFTWQGAYDFMRVYEDGTWEHELDGKYSSDAYVDESIRLIKQHGENHSDKPFFLYLSFQSAHTPIQVPDKYLEGCEHIENVRRKGFCGQMKSIDHGLSKVMETFDEVLGHEDRILLFSSDNGGYILNGGLNTPLQGEKTSAFEGGIKVVGFINDFSGKYVSRKSEYKGLLHIADIFPTMASWVDGDCPADIDGVDQSIALKTNGKSQRNDVIGHWDDSFKAYSYQKGKWKVVMGFPIMPFHHQIATGKEDNYESSEVMDELLQWGLYLVSWVEWVLWNYDYSWFRLEMVRHQPTQFHNAYTGRCPVYDWKDPKWPFQTFHADEIMLFNMEEDISERNDLSEEFPEILNELKGEVLAIRSSLGEVGDWEKGDRRDTAFWYAPPEQCNTAAHRMPEATTVYSQTIFSSGLYKILPCRFLHPWLAEDESIDPNQTIMLVEMFQGLIFPFVVASFVLNIIALYMLYKCCCSRKVKTD